MPTAPPLRYTTIASPIGRLLLLGDGHALHGLYMQGGRKPARVDARWIEDPVALQAVTDQLAEYFCGQRTEFELDLCIRGSEFQRRVWEALRDIPYGQTESYGELARRIGEPSAARAVGLANGSNPLAVVIPCHRVIGADGSLTGYGGGLSRKRLLLELEAEVAARPLSQAQLLHA